MFKIKPVRLCGAATVFATTLGFCCVAVVILFVWGQLLTDYTACALLPSCQNANSIDTMQDVHARKSLLGAMCVMAPWGAPSPLLLAVLNAMLALR